MASASTIRYPVLLGLLCATVNGQSVRLYSEFQRVGPDGEIVAADRGIKPREVISPAAPKNAYVTFRVVVEAPPDQTYYLHLGQNPEDLIEFTLYQEQYQQEGEAWVPDKLTKVTLPHGAKLSEGQKAQTYLLDVFIPPKTPMTRIRIEVQLNVGERWIIYPLELRVRDRTGPGGGRPLGPLAPVRARADMSLMAPLRELVCGDALSKNGPVPMDTLRALMMRNVRQDLAMAREREKEEGAGVAAMLLRAGGWENGESFCKARIPAPRGAEWWLRARVYLYQGLLVR